MISVTTPAKGQIAQERTFYLFTLLTLLTFMPSRAANQVNQTDAPDGFYIGADSAPGYVLPILSNDGGSGTVQIRKDGALVPQNVLISATDLIPGGYFVEVNGQNTEKCWTLPGIVIVANHKAYFGSASRIGSSETVSLLVDNHEQADAVALALQKRYSLQSCDSAVTNAVAVVASGQGTNQTNIWHWDQAKADALLAKGNHDQNITEALAYSQMMYEAREHGMPEPPSQFPFPNFETGPLRPLPIHLNFYSINDHYPVYLLCQYDVNEKNYSPSKESGWFAAALKQIRASGSKKFPHVGWIAVLIDNRADWNGLGTFEQCHKVGAIFQAKDVFDSKHNFSQLIASANMNRHPFKYDQIQPTPGDEQRWLFVEQHAATNNATTK